MHQSLSAKLIERLGHRRAAHREAIGEHPLGR
jgi:hypothetical protein